MKLPKINKKTVIFTLLLVLLVSATISSVWFSIKSIVSLVFLCTIVYFGYKLYKSTPYQREQWGKKYKILRPFFSQKSKS